MIRSIGCDIIEVHRIELAYRRLGNRFLERIFTEEERAFCFSRKNPFPSLAARFAAKEAASKALGCGISAQFGWHDCSIQTDEHGRPFLVWSDRVKRLFGPFTSHLSLSHTHTSALAMVVLETL